MVMWPVTGLKMNGLKNFEVLMDPNNLASQNERTRKRILKDANVIQYTENGKIGYDLWQMKPETIFDKKDIGNYAKNCKTDTDVVRFCKTDSDRLHTCDQRKKEINTKFFRGDKVIFL